MIKKMSLYSQYYYQQKTVYKDVINFHDILFELTLVTYIECSVNEHTES